MANFFFKAGYKKSKKPKCAASCNTRLDKEAKT